MECSPTGHPCALSLLSERGDVCSPIARAASACDRRTRGWATLMQLIRTRVSVIWHSRMQPWRHVVAEGRGV